jgi:protein gp37
MPLKKSTGNMYSWITHTWNPVRGKCPYNCHYCYVGRWGPQPNLHLDERELRTSLGKGNIIFVCSGCDLFHPDIPNEWIMKVAGKTSDWWDNTYLWHTKNPGRAYNFLFPPDSILCATIETNRRYPCMGTSPDPLERVAGLAIWKKKSMVTA